MFAQYTAWAFRSARQPNLHVDRFPNLEVVTKGLGQTSTQIVWNRLTLCAVAVCLICPASLPAQDAAWRIDPNHSAAYFSVRHLMISRVRGEFSGVNGVVRYDPKRPAAASVEATIDCSTLNTGVAKRDAQMKGPDFFDV